MPFRPSAILIAPRFALFVRAGVGRLLSLMMFLGSRNTQKKNRLSLFRIFGSSSSSRIPICQPLFEPEQIHLQRRLFGNFRSDFRVFPVQSSVRSVRQRFGVKSTVKTDWVRLGFRSKGVHHFGGSFFFSLARGVVCVCCLLACAPSAVRPWCVPCAGCWWRGIPFPIAVLVEKY